MIALELPDDREEPAEKIVGLERQLDRSRRVRLPELARINIEEVDAAGIRRNLTREDYLDAVKRIKGHIRDGDVYQVNFSHRFEQPFEGRPIPLFHWQNRHNPIGYLSVDGTVCLNIAIRTVIITGGHAFVQTGGGIVADSDPQAEWDETITKARALLAGIEAVG